MLWYGFSYFLLVALQVGCLLILPPDDTSAVYASLNSLFLGDDGFALEFLNINDLNSEGSFAGPNILPFKLATLL